MVEVTGLEPVVSLLAKQVQLPLCHTPVKMNDGINYTKMAEKLEPQSGIEPETYSLRRNCTANCAIEAWSCKWGLNP